MNLPISPSTDLPPPNVWRSQPLTLPTMYDLPSEDPEEPGLPDTFHGLQPQLLDETLWLPQYPNDQIFPAFDLNLYYDSEHTGWYKRPDWFLCVGVPRLYHGVVTRSSYVMWEERVVPTVVIEFLSPGTESEDLGRFSPKSPSESRTVASGKPPAKFVVYEEILKIPNYIVFDDETKRLRFFRLVNDRYQEQLISPDNPRLWIPELNLGLGLKTEPFRSITQPWLRWCDQSGTFFPTPTESAQAETRLAQAEASAAQAQASAAQAQASAAQAQANAVQRQVEQLQQQQTQSIVKLLGMGMATTQVAEIVGMTVTEIEVVQASL
jgi:Uma2 family endonuclease